MGRTVSINIKRRTAYALAVFPLDIVHRGTIRAMLPRGFQKYGHGSYGSFLKGDGKPATNRVSDKYGSALWSFEKEGWIDRGQTFLRIRNRGALLDFALADLNEVPEHFIEIDYAVEVLERELQRPKTEVPAWEQRRQELLAVQKLMTSAVQGIHWSGRGSVRFVPKGKAL